jgi:hypothetical protein
VSASTLPAARDGRGPLAYVARTLRAAPRWVWGLGLAITLILVALNTQWLLETGAEVGYARAAAVRISIQAWVTFVVLIGWLLADAGSDARAPRRWRVGLALVASAFVAAFGAIAIGAISGVGATMEAGMRAKGIAPPSLGFEVLGVAFEILVMSTLIIATLEVSRRRRLTRAALEAAAAESTALSRRMLESRLAAMQAQVEPQFLFESLVAIEALYERDSRLAAETLDDLIAFLRVALPRLRESGSSLADEFALVQAYARVLASLHGGAPRVTLALPQTLATRRFAPMLLLPLLQRAAREAVPAALGLAARADGDRLIVELDFAQPGLCRADEALARVRERLAGLYGARARLDCTEDAERTRLTITVDSDA